MAEWILLSACSPLVWSGKSSASWDLGLEMASVSAPAFFSCCFIKSLRRYNSAVWQIFCMVAANSWSGLQCGLGRNSRPTGQDRLLTCSFRIDRYFRLLAPPLSIEEMLFLSWRKPSSVLGYLGARILGRMVCLPLMCLSLSA